MRHQLICHWLRNECGFDCTNHNQWHLLFERRTTGSIPSTVIGWRMLFSPSCARSRKKQVSLFFLFLTFLPPFIRKLSWQNKSHTIIYTTNSIKDHRKTEKKNMQIQQSMMFDDNLMMILSVCVWLSVTKWEGRRKRQQIISLTRTIHRLFFTQTLDQPSFLSKSVDFF